MRNIVLSIVATLLCAHPVAAADFDLKTAIDATDALVAAPSGVAACFPDIAGPADVFAVSVYEGAEPVDRGSSGHAISRTVVHVKATANPVLVLATAYESTVWSFVLDPGAKLAGVMLSGYYQPIVEGIPVGTPVGRSYYGEVNQHPGKLCGQTQTPEQLAAQKAAIDEAARKQKDLAQVSATNRGLASNYAQFVAELDLRGASAEMLAMAQSILDDANATSVAAQKAADDQKRVVAALMKLSHGPLVKHLEFNGGRYFYLDDKTDLGKLGGALAALGPYTLVSSQHRYTGPAEGFEISDAVVTADRQRQADGLDELARLQPPPLQRLPAGAPRLVPPTDLGPDEGLQYLVDHGYAVADPAWPQYICALRTAVARAKGHDGNPCEPMYERYLTLLGPITYPYGLYGAHRGLFILPDGVPEPDGERGHSELIRPADVLAGRDRPF